ncbi:MAG: hypothetical protein AAF802_28160 [Planctomycetota bacterium]
MTKPEDAPDRTTLLRFIESASPESQSNGAGSTDLANVVRQVMEKMNADRNFPGVPDLSAPIPVTAVAAYVDGTLEDEQLENQITQCAAADPGLLMEIVAAIDANRYASPPVSDALKAQLLSIVPNTEQSEQTRTISLLSEIDSTPPPRRSSAKNVRYRVTRWAILAAAAALVILGVGLWVRINAQQRNRNQANRPGATSITQSNADREQLDPLPDFRVDDQPRSNTVVESQSDLDVGSELANVPDSKSDGNDFEPDVRGRSQNEPTSMIPNSLANADDDSSRSIGPKRVDTDGMQAPEGTRPPARRLIRWETIDGLMLSGPSFADASTSGGASLQAVQTGFEMDWSNRAASRVQFQTLPMCRASADLGEGSKVILSSDTFVEVTPEATLDVKYGSVAFTDLSPSRVIRLGRTRDESLLIQSPDSGSVRIERNGNGFQIEVYGTLKLNGRDVTDRRLALDGPASAVRDLGETPDRLPRWTRSRVDRIELPRNVLAQISQSDDASVAMMNFLSSGKLKESSADLLRQWLVASNRQGLGRLIAASDAMVREAALQQLSLHRPSDPRHAVIWRGLNSNANGRAFSTLRTFFVDSWAGRRPNATRKDQLVRLMLSPDPATRATTDYLLRSLYGGGPPFVLNPTSAIRSRTATAWRTRISRLD